MRFLRTIKPYWKRILVLLLLGIAAEGVQLASPMLQKILIDDVLTPGSGSSFWSLPRIMTVFVAFYLISTLLSFLVSRFNSVLGAKITLDLRTNMFKHIQSLSQRFFDENKAGTISSRISSSASGVNAIINIWISFITNSFSIATSLIILFTLSPKLSAYALFVLPIYYLFFINFQIRIRQNWRTLHTLRDRISGNLVEKLAAMKVLRVFSMLEHEHKTYQDQIGEEANLNVKTQLLNNYMGTFTNSVKQLMTILVWTTGGYFVLAGKMSLGTLVAYQSYMGTFITLIRATSLSSIQIQNEMVSLERMYEYMDIKPEIAEIERPKTIANPQGEIVFQNVSFSHLSAPARKALPHDFPLKKFYWYPPKKVSPSAPELKTMKKTIHDISFRIRPGEVVALVGPSGSGKSTIIDLLLRTYDPDSGHVQIDGFDLKDLSFQNLQEQMSIVFQDNILFAGSIYDNLLSAKPDASEEEIYEAAKIANAHGFISGFELGYQTILGERGVKLSGGQKQRLAIARAILKNPKIFIMDEATSSLDSENEAFISASVREVMNGRTTLIIAHRLSTIIHADRILVIEDGRIVEEGNHESLVSAKGVYAKLFAKQLEKKSR